MLPREEGPSHRYDKWSRGRAAPSSGEDELICKWLVKACVIFLIGGSEAATSGTDVIHHVIIYLGAFGKCSYLLSRLCI